MLFRIIETGKIKEVSYIVDGIDQAQDMMGNYDALQYDEESEKYVISQDDFDWWRELFVKMEKLDDMIKALNENGINTSDIYSVDTNDLGNSVDEQLTIASELLENNNIEC